MTLREKNILRARIPAKLIKQRQGGGGVTLDYIEMHTVTNRLDRAFSTWDFRIEGLPMNNAYTDSKGKEQYNVIVKGILEVLSEDGETCVKTQFGNCTTNAGIDIGDATKGAASDAFKKCATMLGIGLQLYGEKHYEGPRMPESVTILIKKVSKETGISIEDIADQYKAARTTHLVESQPEDVLEFLNNYKTPQSSEDARVE